MKRNNLILIFLLFLIATPFFYALYTIIAKKVIEHTMAQKLKKEYLQTMTLDRSSVVWLEKGKEILVNGEPFDVKTMQIEGDKLIVAGLFDKAEKQLYNQVHDYCNANRNNATHSNALLILFLTSYYLESTSAYIIQPFFTRKQAFGESRQCSTSYLYADVLIPPPRLLV